jgi:hypothetical protein
MTDLIETLPFSEETIEGYLNLSEIEFDTEENKEAAEKTFAKAVDQEKENWKTINIRVPETVKVLFDSEMDRIRGVVGANNVSAIEMMIVNSANTPLKSFV